MKNPQEMAKADMIAQLVKKNIQGGDAKNGIPCIISCIRCMRLCLSVCLVDK